MSRPRSFAVINAGADRRAAFSAAAPCLWTVLPEMRANPEAMRPGKIMAARLAVITHDEARKEAVRRRKAVTAEAHTFAARKALAALVALLEGRA